MEIVRLVLAAAVGLCLSSAQQAPRVPSVPSVPNIPSIPRASAPRPFPAPGNTRRSGVSGNAPPSQNGACASAGRSAIAQCFQSNGGFQMPQVISLMSRGSQGAVPGNAQRLTEAICAKEGTILACVFEGVNSLEGGAQCPARPDFLRLEQETVNLVTGVQLLCGKGPLPAPTPCLTDLNRNLKACFREVDLDPGIFVPSSAIYSTSFNLSQTVGAMIGRDSQAAGKFCSVKQRLFTCMKAVINRCEGSSEMVALSGFEPESLRKGIEVLCHDVNVYLDGLKCFQNAPAAVERCYDDLSDKISQLTAQQVQRSMPLNQFYDRFCQTRIQHMECDLQAWRSQCSQATIGLKTEFECNLLPTRCKNDRSLQGRLQETCAVKRFQRHLRSAAVKPLTVSAILMTTASLLMVLFL